MENVPGCKKWLIAFLTVNGETDSKTVSAIARRMGYTKTELGAARALAGVKTRHYVNYLLGGSKWLWSLGS